MRVGHLNYINIFPLYQQLIQNADKNAMRFVPGVPSTLNEMLSQDKLDVSLVSSYEYIRHQEFYELVPGFCIAAKFQVDTVTLHVKGSLQNLDQKPVALSSQSATSSQLVKVLCKEHWNIDPKFCALTSLEEASNYPAFLVIGDDALRKPHFNGYTPIDLAESWTEYTGHPMVFAVFAVRKAFAKEHPEKIASLVDQIDASLTWAERNKETIEDLAHQASEFSKERLKSYYELLRYRLKEEELEGLSLFAEKCGYPLLAPVI